MMLKTFSVEQLEQKRKRRLERKANRHVPRGDLGHYLLPTVTRGLYKQGNISQKIAAETSTTMEVTNLMGSLAMDHTTHRTSIDMTTNRGTDTYRPQTTALITAISGRRTSHNVDFETSFKEVPNTRGTRRPQTARRDSHNIDFETSFKKGGLSPCSTRRPQTAGGNYGHVNMVNTKKKNPKSSGLSIETDIAHVSCDLEKIRKKALKDSISSWRAADYLLLPSVRSQMTIQLLEEDPIRFHPKELEKVSIKYPFTLPFPSCKDFFSLLILF